MCFAGSEDVSCCAVDHIAACEELGFRHTWGMRRTYLMKHMMRDVQTIFQPMTKECPDEPVFLVVVGSVGWDIFHSDGHTRNCWKPVVLDRPLKPSSGITFAIYAATQISSGLLSGFTFSVLSQKYLLPHRTRGKTILNCALEDIADTTPLCNAVTPF